ncbi:hypothetical protein PRIPAC_80826 [Pristionchus pacificus]|uniref:START domain-containing protein n=1 Tax=Pristionchus pacificus TaxID=54126 RepID=H3FVR3_PRIPA|nr:hypothetical protein PRIPAC_78646 [Pristionchus pacificus]KAF8374397.1 hypothetical protein PRIPAC_80826 [Pristionchus pacificus]|eukprot:PDM79249.1 hypothetical protein PRIPAC_31828 [Pristionchus pacificus]
MAQLLRFTAPAMSSLLLLLPLLAGDVMAATSVTIHGVTDTLKPEHEKYASALKDAEAAFLDAEKVFNDPSFETKEGWHKEGKHPSFSSWSKPTPQGKMVLVSTVLDGNIDDVMHETWGGIEALPSWNPSIAFANYYAVFSDNADILYYANNDILVVTGRDFLTTRIYRKTPKGYIMASRSVDLPEKPERKERVRANVFLGASQFRPDPTNNRKTLCDVIMIADMRGNLPKEMVEKSMPAMMSMLTEQNIKHFHELSKYSRRRR